MNDAVKEITGILAETPMCFVATVSGNEPRVRAFQYQFEQDGKLWFCTARSKDVFRQLQANPAVQVCAVRQDMTWLRVSGKVSLEDNRAVKERILSEVAHLVQRHDRRPDDRRGDGHQQRLGRPRPPGDARRRLGLRHRELDRHHPGAGRIPQNPWSVSPSGMSA